MMYRSVLPALAILLCAPAQAYDFARVGNEHIVPAYQQLKEQSNVLKGAIDAHCTAPTDATRARANSAYMDAFLAWQATQQLRFGPIQYLSREHRYALWPDKRGTVARHTAKLLADPALLAKDFELTGKSVAVQGFSALERLLAQAAAPDAPRCALMRAIGANLAGMSARQLSDWRDGDESYLAHFSTPGSSLSLYENEAEVAAELLNSLYTQLEFMVTQKLARPLEKGRRKSAESWRNNAALPALKTNLRATEALYRLAFSPALQGDATQTRIDGDILAAFAAAHRSADAIDRPLGLAVGDAEGQSKVQAIQQHVSTLKGLIGRDMANNLQLPVGFNSLDGD